ncbi:MAG: hypothetical protein DMF90_23830 [Acidobacteria bacterium]|nr:MAG: hypothetical protein DMF90_23830 [Acidobacteriota bacterium]
MVFQPDAPIIIKIIELPETPMEGLGDVLLSALGITGVLVLGAVVLGLLLGSLMFWFRGRSASGAD